MSDTTSIGKIKNNEILNISSFYEMSIFTANELYIPLPIIMCSNDGDVWVKYCEVKNNYMYLSDLMANHIRVDSHYDLDLDYNANLKK